MLPRASIAASVCLLACLALPLLGHAETPELTLPSFSGLQQKATESVDISIGSFALSMLGWAMDDHDATDADLKSTLQGLKAVHVRSYRFDSDAMYREADLDAIRSQLSAPGWSHLVQVRDRNKHENVDICIALDDHSSQRKIKGLAIVVSDPRGFTVLNIIGAIDLDRAARVQKALGIPDSAVVPVAQFTH
jgi:hypothetical protein